MNEASARPDKLAHRLGQGQQRQVTFGQSDSEGPAKALRELNLNESIGQAGRSSHFEFGTPDPNETDFKRNEIPHHAKGGMKDHNQSTENYYQESFADPGKARPEQDSHFDFGGGSPSPAIQQGSHRGPPTSSFDVNADQQPEHNIHGREYNMSRRPPPQSQYDFVSGGSDEPVEKPGSRSSSQRFAQTADENSEEAQNVHGRQYNMSRRPPPQAQYDFMGDSSGPEQRNTSRASVRRFTPTGEQPENVHGREYNMSRRPPPQAQYDLMSESTSEAQQSFGRASQRRFTPTEEPDNIHGREFNMSRRPPPQAQYDFMSDSSAQDNDKQSFGRATQRGSAPAEHQEDDNIHGRAFNMGVSDWTKMM